MGPLAKSGSWAISVRDRDPVALRPAVAGGLPLSETRSGKTTDRYYLGGDAAHTERGSTRVSHTATAERTADRPSARLRPPVDQDFPDIAIVPHALERLGRSRGRQHRVDGDAERPRGECREDLRAKPRDECRLLCAAAGSHGRPDESRDRKSTRLNSSHSQISYAVFCLKKKTYPVR